MEILKQVGMRFFFNFFIFNKEKEKFTIHHKRRQEKSYISIYIWLYSTTKRIKGKKWMTSKRYGRVREENTDKS